MEQNKDFPFKVGDRVTDDSWVKGCFVEIVTVYHKERCYFGMLRKYGEKSQPIADKFDAYKLKLYQEEKPKDLADVFEYYVLHENEGRKRLVGFLGNQIQFENHKEILKGYKNEVITKEEAQERGLKVD